MNLPKPLITRRQMFIAGSAAILGGTAFLARDILFSVPASLADNQAARRLGERFYKTYPDPNELWRGNPPHSVAQWGERLSALLNEDFETNRLVQVDGWWLAETELRLCVLIYELKL